jgi:hypothetical protein
MQPSQSDLFVRSAQQAITIAREFVGNQNLDAGPVTNVTYESAERLSNGLGERRDHGYWNVQFSEPDEVKTSSECVDHTGYTIIDSSRQVPGYVFIAVNDMTGSVLLVTGQTIAERKRVEEIRIFRSTPKSEADFPDLAGLEVDFEPLQLVPIEMARENHTLAVAFEDDAIRIVIPDDDRYETGEKMAFILNRRVIIDTADQHQIDAAIEYFYSKIINREN